MKKLQYLLLISFLAAFNAAQACTNFLITKGATVDGSNFISYCADSHIRYGELYFTPAADWPEGSMRVCYYVFLYLYLQLCYILLLKYFPILPVFMVTNLMV